LEILTSSRKSCFGLQKGVQRGEIDIVDRDKDGDNDLFITGITGDNNDRIVRRDYNNSYYYRNQYTNVGTGT
jgi:hypothetical protein